MTEEVQSKVSVADRVRDLVLPLLSDRGLDLYDLEMHSGVLRVVVDKSDATRRDADDGRAGLDLDVLAGVTRAVSRALDEADPIAGRYTLEVTSPGIERALRTPEHFRRAVGETVKVRTVAGVADERRIEGVITAADEVGIVVRTGTGDDGEPVERHLDHAEIERARTAYEWGPAADKGRRKGSAPRRGRPESDDERERSR
jgi:ribosome maturation factor RimP